VENRGRNRDAAAHMITRTQEQRTNTVHHRNTRLQQRFQDLQVQEMADERLLTYRSSSKNRQAESSRQTQRNIAARAQLSEDEREDQRERQRRRSRATAREQYLRNIMYVLWRRRALFLLEFPSCALYPLDMKGSAE